MAADGDDLASVVGAVVENLVDKFKACLSALHPGRVEAHGFLQTSIVERLDEGEIADLILAMDASASDDPEGRQLNRRVEFEITGVNYGNGVSAK